MIYTYKAKKLQSCMSSLVNIQLLVPEIWIAELISPSQLFHGHLLNGNLLHGQKFF